MFETKKTLIVVYKDELLMNQLKKMVETHDDAHGISEPGTILSVLSLGQKRYGWIIRKRETFKGKFSSLAISRAQIS